MISENGISVSADPVNARAEIFAGDYLNKLSGEKIEYECRRHIEAGCKELIVNFSKTEIVNSIGISILLDVIDTAQGAGALVVFSDVNESTIELFDMLGVTKHVTLVSGD